jgi:hypothetical protein
MCCTLEYRTPRSSRWPARSSSAAIARNDIWPPFRLPAPELQGNHLGACLDVRSPTAALAGTRTLAITRCLQLGDERGLVELRDRAEHLTHQDRGRRILGEMIGRAGRHRTPSPPINGNGSTVFGKLGHGFTTWADGKATLDRTLGPAFQDWRLHDVRRTVATGLAKLGIDLPVIERVLNHFSGSFAGIVGVYQRHDFADEKRQALALWASHLMTVVAVPAPAPANSKPLAPAAAAA